MTTATSPLERRPGVLRRAWRACTRTRRRKVASVVVVLALIAAGSAFAAWLLTVTDPDAKGKISALTAVTEASITGAASPTGQCFPGNSCDAVIRLTNPVGNGPLRITAITKTASLSVLTGSVTGQKDPASCSAADLQSKLSIASQPSVNIPVPTGTNDITIPALIQLASDTSDACQGTSYTLSSTGVNLTLQP